MLIGYVRIGSMFQQQFDRVYLAMQRRQHQGRAAIGVARIDIDPFIERSLQTRDVPGFRRPT